MFAGDRHGVDETGDEATLRALELEVYRQEVSPISSQNFISFNNISNILRYVYEKPPHNKRKCG